MPRTQFLSANLAIPSVELKRSAWPYYQEMLAQPGALADTLSALKCEDGIVAAGAAMRAEPRRRLVLTGMGASLCTLVPLQLDLIAGGLAPIVLETSELIHNARSLLSPSSTVIAVSQSGCSAEILGLLQCISCGFLLIGVTNQSASPLAARAHHVILTRAGTETSVSSKTYISTLAALEFLRCLLLGNELAPTIGALKETPRIVQDYLSNAETHVTQLKETLSDIGQVYFVGRGRSLAAAFAGGLITKECAGFPAEGMSSASFRHGPLEVVGADVYVVVFEGDGHSSRLNRQLVKDVREAGGKATLCGLGASEGPFLLPRIDPLGLPILEILPPQLVALTLSVLRGRVPGRLERVSKVTATE
jgi:glutamine---fructose-6-phosphate transaminase (isomerizing)